MQGAPSLGRGDSVEMLLGRLRGRAGERGREFWAIETSCGGMTSEDDGGKKHFNGEYGLNVEHALCAVCGPGQSRPPRCTGYCAVVSMTSEWEQERRTSMQGARYPGWSSEPDVD